MLINPKKVTLSKNIFVFSLEMGQILNQGVKLFIILEPVIFDEPAPKAVGPQLEFGDEGMHTYFYRCHHQKLWQIEEIYIDY